MANKSPTAALIDKAKTAKGKTTSKAPATKKVETDLTFESIVSQIENFDKPTAEKTIHELMDHEGLLDFQLGGVLSLVKNHGWWSEEYPTFKDYLTEEYGLQYRKATYLISIYDNLVESGVDHDKVKHIGWSKLKDLAPILTPDNVDEWVQRADELTLLQLIDAIQAYKTLGDDTDAVDGSDITTKATNLTTLSFKLHKDQKEIVKEALEHCKEETKTEFDAVAIERICMQYMEAGTGKPKETKPTKANVVKYLTQMGDQKAIDLLEQAFPDISISVAI